MTQPHAEPVTTRTALANSELALVEDLRYDGAGTPAAFDGFSPTFQLCFPYSGSFVWHVGRDEVVGDANQVLFVSGGEPFRLSQPNAARYAELIVTPSHHVLADITSDGGRHAAAHPLFRRRNRRAEPSLQRRAALLRHWGHARRVETLAFDEVVLGLLRSSLQSGNQCRSLTHATLRVSRAAKEYLQAHLTESVRVMDIARVVGVSPTYLTDLFRRTEGVSMHRYMTQLRLARALVELPNTNDLTALALELGFSSHSHFTALFTRAFGESPSSFREAARFKRHQMSNVR